MIVEVAKVGDWEAMSKVFANAGRAAWTHIVSADALLNLSPADRWLAIVQNPRPQSTALVARVEGEVKGFIVLRPSGDDDATSNMGEVDSFYTDPSVWGQGVGQALMGQGIQFLREAGFEIATLWTEARNHRPRRFYERYGWELDGKVRHRIGKESKLEELRYRIRL